MPRLAIAITLLALSFAVSGCGGDDDAADKPGSSSTATTEAKEDTRPPGKVRPPKEAKAARAEAAEEEQAAREFKDLRQEDREFDRSFRETSFEGLVGKLPIGKPPLYVEQYITGEGHKLYTAVRRKRFCKLPAAGREKAVASFFQSADRVFRRAKVKDFEQVVTPLSETIEKLPALATARRNRVSLTSRGRDC